MNSASPRIGREHMYGNAQTHRFARTSICACNPSLYAWHRAMTDMPLLRRIGSPQNEVWMVVDRVILR